MEVEGEEVLEVGRLDLEARLRIYIIPFFLYDYFPADVAFARLLGWL